MIKENASKIREKINAINSDVTIVAAIKKQALTKIKDLLNCGVNDLGVNYLQQYNEIVSLLPETVNWHYIGKIQSKKVKHIVGHFDLVHSVSSLKNIDDINKECLKKQIQQKILLQVNIAEEDSKQGFLVSELDEVSQHITSCEGVLVKGFMLMPPQEQGLQYFKQGRELFQNYKKSYSASSSFALDYLSMGTSGDYVDAVSCGATHVRLGTVLLGERV